LRENRDRSCQVGLGPTERARGEQCQKARSAKRRGAPIGQIPKPLSLFGSGSKQRHHLVRRLHKRLIDNLPTAGGTR
jgi:hypothetical protein